MKIDKNTLAFIHNVVTTAQIVNIDGVIIEPGRVRGMDEERTVVLFNEDSSKAFEFGSIGLNRTNVFLSRLDLIRNIEGFNVTAALHDSGDFVRSLTMKAKGTTVDYRCANPTTVTAPRVINDEMAADVTLGNEDIVLLQKSVAAMGNSELVNFISDESGIYFELQDVNTDKFNHRFSEPIDYHFAFKYPVKIMLSLIKNRNEVTISVGKKGIAKFVINDLGLYVLPRV